MAEMNIMSYTVKSLLIGFVLMGMITFFITFVNNEGKGEIFDEYPELERLNQNITNIYTDGEILDVANVNSNLSGDYNPEIAISAADQSGNAININLQNIATQIWVIMGVLFYLMFGTTVGKILTSLLIAVAGMYGTYLFVKNIRTGT